MKKGWISNLLRQTGCLPAADRLRFLALQLGNFRKNREFKNRHPTVMLPPDYLMYESFQIDYEKYYQGGRQTALWIAEHLSKHMDLKHKRILDWGCGPGRVIRHLPQILGNGCQFIGTDYNAASIRWCSENLPGIRFLVHPLNSRLPFEDNYMDAIYGISVFTHLSAPLHFSWYDELYRILTPGGTLLLTTQGNNFLIKLTNHEIRKFKSGQLVVRGNVKEGHRTFSAFHPPAFMKRLFSNADILEHLVPQPENGKPLPQDVWIVRKPLTPHLQSVHTKP